MDFGPRREAVTKVLLGTEGAPLMGRIFEDYRFVEVEV